jgi:hypothetical protein
MAESEERKEISVGAALIGSAALALVVGLATTALQIAGVVNMAMAHLLMAFAWLVAVGSICLIESHEYTVKFRIISVVVVSIILGGLDFWMVSERAKLDMASALKELPRTEPTTVGKYVCTTDLTVGGGKYALIVEFGIRRGRSNGLVFRVDFESPYEKKQGWAGSPLRTDRSEASMMAYEGVQTLEDPSHMFYQERFMSPSLTPQQSYYLYFEGEKPLRIKSLIFIEDYHAVSDQLRVETLARQVDLCPRGN